MVTLQLGTDPKPLELLHGACDGGDFALEGRLEADECFVCADCEGGNHKSLYQLIRVAVQQCPVLERAWLALGAVAHEIAAAACLRGDARPLLASGESATSSSAQARPLDDVDGFRWPEILGSAHAGPAGVGCQICLQ